MPPVWDIYIYTTGVEFWEIAVGRLLAKMGERRQPWFIAAKSLSNLPYQLYIYIR